MTTLKLPTPIVIAALAVAGACGPSRSSGGHPNDRGTITGRVVSGPTCPVERPGTACATPLHLDVVARPAARMSEHPEATTRSGPDGTFRLTVAPGQYEVTVVVSGGLPRCDRPSVRVIARQNVTVDINCDSGIR